MKQYLEQDRHKGASKELLDTINQIHMYLRSEFENRKGVEFDYTRTGGLSCFALGKKRNAKFCYLRFESAYIDDENVKSRFVALYLLKTPKNDYKVPVIKGITAHQSYHGFEFYTLKSKSKI